MSEIHSYQRPSALISVQFLLFRLLRQPARKIQNEMDPTQRKFLRQVIIEHFNNQELRTLCGDLNVDYDNLPGEAKEDKARELIEFMKRRGRLEELVDAIREARPHIILFFEPERTGDLHNQLRNELQPTLQPVFYEFTSQIRAYVTQFTQLHNELEEWKELHNALHSIHNCFETCHSHAISLKHGIKQDKQESLIYTLSYFWEYCKNTQLWKLRDLAKSVKWINDSHNTAPDNDPEWFKELYTLAGEINEVFQEENFDQLPERFSSFNNVLNQWLVRADIKLRKVVEQIQSLPPPFNLPR